MSTDVEMTAEDAESSPPLPPPRVEYPDVITSVALFLSNKVKAHDIKFQTTRNPKTNFTSSYPPQITIDNYLFHLIRNVRTSPGIVVYALIYIERIIGVLERKYQRQTRTSVPFLMTSYNAHRLVLTAFLLAHKYCEDYRYDTSRMAKIGGILPKELLKLEKEFLKFIKFSLYVSEDEFIKYHNAVLVYGRELVSLSRP
mmetsp:Transcript_3161/g.2877  ORF Transcript_3161/g.2877 Transcript_3161/m.2877 type:complete len:199 (-) Transcript_3161:373-969(-)|eukprot:CAMPEP_0197004772 /NCGR_PEP_ID=MMETSP1380-20130617/25540_1 /TAXON_ID=5936 /ORGANISM="Euplotes crassus, Strain CT5" /LENGTH=198 /DNA_ID=CAMNT_0042423685 /DNA_START=20 /DNA_END=616 /DNA_ORIENTATION=-